MKARPRAAWEGGRWEPGLGHARSVGTPALLRLFHWSAGEKCLGFRTGHRTQERGLSRNEGTGYFLTQAVASGECVLCPPRRPLCPSDYTE